MGDMAEVFRDMREMDKEQKERNLSKANPEGWTQHTEFHWSRDLAGSRLDYWPSRNKFQYRGKVMRGDVDGFIRNRTKDTDNDK